MQAISDYIFDSGTGKGNIIVNTSIYSMEAINAAIYPYTGRYHILITPSTSNTVIVIFEQKDDGQNIIFDLKEFANALIDHQVRVQLDQKNGKIRDLIVAHAFSPLDLHKEISSH
jgi:His-Xaa-Ser system protein HxsD